MFGRTDLAAIARGFGVRGENVTTLGRFEALLADYESGDTAMVWNVHVSDRVMSPRMRHGLKAGHGVR